MARQRIHNRRASRGAQGGFSWISYSDMMAALLLIFVLILTYSLYQYFTMLETKTLELDLKNNELEEQKIALNLATDELNAKEQALVIIQMDLDQLQDKLSAQEEELNSLVEGDIIEMIGDDGETVSFIFVDALEYEGDIYLALAEPEEDDAVFFLKVEHDEEGNDVYNAPDEELEDILFQRFSEMRGENE